MCVSARVDIRGHLSEVSSFLQLWFVESELKFSGLPSKSMYVGTRIQEGVWEGESPTWETLWRSTSRYRSIGLHSGAFFNTAFGPMGN